jgi:hypothetical protein
MIFSLIHSFLQFFCVVVIVRMMLPAQYALLNPYAATLDNLLTRLMTKLKQAMPLPVKSLCGVLLVLAICADAVMLSRMQLNAFGVNIFTAFTLPAVTFKQWLLIAVLQLFRHVLMILATLLVLQLWHRSRTLPGFSGDLLRLAVLPVERLKTGIQWVVLLGGMALLAFMLNWHAETVSYPFEALKTQPGILGEVATRSSLSQLTPGLRFVAVVGLMVMDVFAELHSFTTTLILFAILCVITRNQSLSYFINDVFRLLRGPLPEFRIGFLYLTPVLILVVLSAAGGVLPALFLMLIELIANIGGFHVV